MATEDIAAYYDDTTESEVRDDLKKAIEVANDSKIAIDCGCGAGSDIAYLLKEGYTVHAFDIEAESIQRCHQRFHGEANLYLSESGFNTFNYPPASSIGGINAPFTPNIL